MSFMSERYPVDGSFESYSRLMWAASHGDLDATETIEWYQQYQELSRDVRVKRIPPPPPIRKAAQTVTAAEVEKLQQALDNLPRSTSWPFMVMESDTGSEVIARSTTAELKKLQRDLNRMYPSQVRAGITPHVHCDVTGCTEKKPYAPPGVHFASHARIGDEVRNTYLDHLGAMFSGGNIDQAEYEARSDAAVKASTKEELDFLLQDLPYFAAVKKEDSKADPRKRFIPGPLVPAVFLGGSATVIFMPGVSMTGMIVFAVTAFLWLLVLVAGIAWKH